MRFGPPPRSTNHFEARLGVWPVRDGGSGGEYFSQAPALGALGGGTWTIQLGSQCQ